LSQGWIAILLNLSRTGANVFIGIVEEEVLCGQTKGFLFFISFRDILPDLLPLNHSLTYMGNIHLRKEWKKSYSG